jgi:hypothetical protein
VTETVLLFVFVERSNDFLAFASEAGQRPTDNLRSELRNEKTEK